MKMTSDRTSRLTVLLTDQSRSLSRFNRFPVLSFLLPVLFQAISSALKNAIEKREKEEKRELLDGRGIARV